MALDNDNRKAMDALFGALFTNHNYGKQTVLGSVEHLRNPSLKSIREYYKTYYVPNNMGIIMSGDLDPNEIIAKIDSAFRDMKPKTVSKYSFDPENTITQPILRQVNGANPEFILMGFRLPGAASAEARMLSLINEILSNGSAGLIDLNVVKTQKLLGARAYAYPFKDYSILILQGNPLQGQSLDKAKELLLAEIGKLRNGDFTDDLLTSIINNQRRVEIEKYENYKYKAEDLMYTFTSELNRADELAYIDWLATVTKEEIVRFANKYLGDQNYAVVYKTQGADNNTIKVVKPTITPIAVNRANKSDFYKSFEEMPEDIIKPQWVDYEKAIEKVKVNDQPLYTVLNKDNELFSLTYHFKVGRWNNKLLGLAANYLEFLGTKDKSSEEISRELYSLASSFSVSSGNEETNITISGLNTNFERSVAFLQDLIKNCIANQDAFSAYIQRIYKSRSNAKENKSAIAEGLRSYAKYGAHNPFNYTFTDAELVTLKAEDLVQVIHELSRMQHTLLYYGPEQASEVTKLLKPLKDNGIEYAKAEEGTYFFEVPTTQNNVLFANYKMKQVDIFWLRNSERYDRKNTPTVALFNNYFGGGMGCIVFQTLRESKALAYSTYATYGQPSKAGQHYTISAYIGTQSDKFKEAVEGMNELLNQLPESEIAMETAKTSLVKSIASQRITGSDILRSYLAAEKLGNRTDIRKDIFMKIPKMEYKDLQAFHRRSFNNTTYSYCIIGDETNLNMEQLEALGIVKKLSLKEIFGY